MKAGLLVSALSDLISRCLAAGGLTQADLARNSSGVLSEQQISQWVNDSRPLRAFPAPQTIRALAKGLGVTDDVVINACAATIGLTVHQEQLDEHRELMLATVRDIPTAEVPKVLRMLRAYLKSD